MKFASIRFAIVVVCLIFAVATSAQEASNQSAAAAQASSQTTVPQLIKFSGTLLDEQSRPMQSTVGVTFALYAQETGGAALWMETQNVKPDANGNYNVLLGAASANGVPEELFASGQARWLGLEVQGQPQQLRVLLVSVPYALKAGDAQTLGGLPASAFMIAPSAASGTASAPAAATSDAAVAPTTGPLAAIGGSGTTNFIPLWTPNGSTLGNSALFQTGGKVGLGNTSPGATLDVTGGGIFRGSLQLPATGTATSGAGFNSNTLDAYASAWNSTVPAKAQNELFRWQVEPVGNNSTTPSGKLNLLFGANGAAPAETGLSISSKGLFTFATGQKFSGAGTITGITTAAGSGLTGGVTSGMANLSLLKTCTTGQTLGWNGTAWGCVNSGGSGTITGVTAGIGLSGGGTTGNVTLNLASNSCAPGQALSALPFTCTPFATLGANTFTGDQKVTGNISGTGNLTATGSVSGATGNFSGKVATGNQTVTGNVSATGLVSGAAAKFTGNDTTDIVNVAQSGTGRGIDVSTTSGDGIDVTSTGGSGIFVLTESAGSGIVVNTTHTPLATGSGIAIVPGGTGPGITVSKPPSAGDGMVVDMAGPGKGIGVTTTTGDGIDVTSTSGSGIFVLTEGAGSGIVINTTHTPLATGAGIDIVPGGTGPGITINKPPGVGDGMVVAIAGTGDGIVVTSSGGHAINATTDATATAQEAVHGVAQKDADYVSGVTGFAPGATRLTVGVVGQSMSSPLGVGVLGFGVSQSTTFLTPLQYPTGVWGDSGVVSGVGVQGTADNGIALTGTNNSAQYPALFVANLDNSSKTNPVLTTTGNGTGDCMIDVGGDLKCTGTKSAVVPVDGGVRQVALYAVEAPDNWFEDAGSGQLSNGSAVVTLEPTFAQTVNTVMDYHVFLTPNGDCKGLFVTQKTPASFEVRELGGGTSNIVFDYRIMARRHDYENLRLADVTDQFRAVSTLRNRGKASFNNAAPVQPYRPESGTPARRSAVAGNPTGRP